MKKALITIIAFTSFSIVKAQQSSSPSNNANGEIRIDMPDTSSVNRSKIFTAVEMEPSFAGGIEMFYRFLQSNIRYPAKAFEDKIQGKVFVSFVVEKDGSLTDIKVLRGIGGGCDEEAVRVMKISPKWRPGIQNGRPVRVQYTMPINFIAIKR